MRVTPVSFLKFVGFLLVLPIFIGATISFQKEINSLPLLIKPFFGWGIMTYLILHIFVWKPKAFHHYGQKIVSEVFSFYAPLGNVLYHILPLYTFLLLIFLTFNVSFFKLEEGTLSTFLIGFTLAMHIVLTAEELYDNDPQYLKPQYFLKIGGTLVACLFLVIVFYHSVYAEIEIKDFVNQTIKNAELLYTFSYNQFMDNLQFDRTEY